MIYTKYILPALNGALRIDNALYQSMHSVEKLVFEVFDVVNVPAIYVILQLS